jgi:hypothetical protein
MVVLETSGSPAQVTLVSEFGTDGIARGIALDAATAFVASEYRLVIFDITVPRRPIRLAALVLDNAAHAVAVRDGRAYVLTGHGLTIVDVTDPRAPRLLSTVRSPGGYPYPGRSNRGEVLALGDYVTVSGGLDVAMIDVRDTAAPEVVDKLSPPHGAFGLAASGQSLFVTGFGTEVAAIDVRQPDAMKLDGVIPAMAGGEGIAIRADSMVVAEAYAGLGLYDLGPGSVPTPTWTALPSPTRTATPTRGATPKPRFLIHLPFVSAQARLDAPPEARTRSGAPPVGAPTRADAGSS